MQKQGCEQLTLFPEDSPANRSASQESGGGGTMTVISGRKCAALLPSCDPLGLLVRMLLESSAWGNPLVTLTWKAEQLTACRTTIITKRYCHSRKECSSSAYSKTLSRSDTPSSRWLFRLVPSARRTVGTESQLWPTVRAVESGDYQYSQGRHDRPVLTLTGAVKLWPTPTAGQCGMTATTSGRPIERSTHLGTQVMLAERMYPTPIATDYKNRGCKDYRKNRQYQLQTEVGGQLNPTWVEWLMGFPIGWTDLEG